MEKSPVEKSRQFQPWSKGYWIFTILATLALTLFLLSANWNTYRKLASDGVYIKGTVTTTGCETGGEFKYIFVAEGESYAGNGRAWRINMSCAQMTPGRQVPVYYLPENPEKNAATRDPAALARQEFFIVLGFGLGAFLLIQLTTWLTVKYSRK